LKKEKKKLRLKKLLVPTDFSVHSDYAVDYAARIARAFKARVVLMHVTEPSPYTVTDTLVVVEYGRMLDKVAQSLLTNLGRKLAAKGLAVKTYLAYGSPYREIVEKAAKEKADLIVMGTHGHRGIGHILLGSVAEKVVRLAGCPVLTVRSASDGKTGNLKKKKK
jgi:nucleotide-binding universal stress UspA family protein